MFRKLMCAVFVMTVSIGLVAADEFGAVVKKVDGDKVTFYKVKKGEKGEDTTLPAAKDVKVAKGKANKDTKKYEAGDAIEGGLKNDLFKSEKGVTVRITTDADNKNITQILVTTPKKKKDAK